MNRSHKSLKQLFIPIYLEMLCSTLTGLVDTAMVSSVGDQTVGAVGTANTYISTFIIMFSIISTGMVAVITVYIGAGKLGAAYQAKQLGLVFNSVTGIILSLFLGLFSGNILQFVGIAAAVSLAVFFAAVSDVIMSLFTKDPYMKMLVGRLLLIDIVLEIGRVTNLVFGSALKTSGDAIFTTIIAVIFMYLCAVGGTYWFGMRLNWLVIGAYVGMTLDECVRAICMLFRWRSGKWRCKLAIGRN